MRYPDVVGLNTHHNISKSFTNRLQPGQYHFIKVVTKIIDNEQLFLWHTRTPKFFLTASIGLESGQNDWKFWISKWIWRLSTKYHLNRMTLHVSLNYLCVLYWFQIIVFVRLPFEPHRSNTNRARERCHSLSRQIRAVIPHVKWAYEYLRSVWSGCKNYCCPRKLSVAYEPSRLWTFNEFL